MKTQANSRSILHVCYYPSLLHTRHAMLEVDGHAVTSVLGNDQGKALATTQDFDVALVGFSSTLTQRTEIIRWLKKTRPQRPVVALRSLRCLLTFAIQAVVLAVVLVWADHRYPSRGWINLGYALLFYVIWYVTGQIRLLARPDSEGADLGFMTVGALITFPVGIIAALL